jgi:hypothetical protein
MLQWDFTSGESLCFSPAHQLAVPVDLVEANRGNHGCPAISVNESQEGVPAPRLQTFETRQPKKTG